MFNGTVHSLAEPWCVPGGMVEKELVGTPKKSYSPNFKTWYFDLVQVCIHLIRTLPAQRKCRKHNNIREAKLHQAYKH